MESPSFIVCEEIKLTDQEEKIFDTLKEVLRINGKNTVLRVAGGGSGTNSLAEKVMISI